MTIEPTICPFCWEKLLGQVPCDEPLSLFSGRFEACSVMAYRCAHGHLLLIPNGVVPLEATAGEIFV